MCLMLCAPLDWQYAELPSTASDAVLCSVLVRKMWVILPNRKEKRKKKGADLPLFFCFRLDLFHSKIAIVIISMTASSNIPRTGHNAPSGSIKKKRP